MSRLSPVLRVQPFTVATYRFAEQFDIDTVGPLPKDDFGYEYVLVVIDDFTRFVRLHPMRTYVGAKSRSRYDRYHRNARLFACHTLGARSTAQSCWDSVRCDRSRQPIRKKRVQLSSGLIKKLTDTCAR
jgi:hypothetical protein